MTIMAARELLRARKKAIQRPSKGLKAAVPGERDGRPGNCVAGLIVSGKQPESNAEGETGGGGEDPP